MVQYVWKWASGVTGWVDVAMGGPKWDPQKSSRWSQKVKTQNQWEILWHDKLHEKWPMQDISVGGMFPPEAYEYPPKRGLVGPKRLKLQITF